MRLIKVAAAAINQTPLDWDQNCQNIFSVIEAARDQDVSIVCLPELCVTGYGCEDAFQSAGVRRMALSVLAEVAPATTGMIVSVGLPISYQQNVYNVACLLCDGKVVGFVGKQNLAGDGIHYEPRWFRPWPANTHGNISFAGQQYPLGDLVFDCDGVRIGFEICEDAWVADRPGERLAHLGVDIILNPSASHFAFGKNELRRKFVLEGSQTFGVSYVYSNLVGNESGRAIYDGGTMIASGGAMLAEGRRFSFTEYQITSAVVDLEKNRMSSQVRNGQQVADGQTPIKAIVPVPFAFSALKDEVQIESVPSWETGTFQKEEEFTRAVALGLFDYMRKSLSCGFVVSLSGGVDSATVATLCAMMVKMSVAELGLSRFKEKLNYISLLTETDSAVDAVRCLLTCVYQATRNSGDVTRAAAREVAGSLDATYLEYDVDKIVSGYTEMVAHSLGRKLTWANDDLALQNIQARVRSPGVWMLANIQRSLLLSTSNRSEAAVGYATMDGDTSGGLAPIAGIDKAFLRKWLAWMRDAGPEGQGPIPALLSVSCQQPTAELRPAGAGQTDEADLMPYDVLDLIERAAIRDKLMPCDVLKTVVPRFPQHSRVQLGEWVERFFRLWCRNQWKRERYAPSFHLDDENVDPKTWCRFPILSGGFKRELAELRNVLARELPPLS